MDEQTARAWIDALQRAWLAQDANAMAELFTDDATAQTDPFKTPVRGRDNLRKGFAWWMKDQREIQMTIGNVDIIGNRFYAEIDAHWIVASSGEKIQERGLLVCDLEGARARVMREFWKTKRP
ncbi:MAG: nuclear transport factor 2 family protein [Chloroflexi bacterium]|nr:nuclear transport factor 2 family protein [Chloroflexota bacterium]